MDRFQFKNHLALVAEPYKGKLRFVVYANKEEFVCRIETIKNIEQFIQAKEARIVKGRLQLYKISNKVNVEVKGNRIGSITVQQLKQMITSLFYPSSKANP